ncbi:DUF5813 family protein [Halorubrum sp. DTA46]|uniref:DUF5813 family protein n=1 Tax=Halorubrum sp. DTA46 TaxID=3402162 RepID=UPI003AAE2058
MTETETETDLPGRVRRAFADHGSFEPAGGDGATASGDRATASDGRAAASASSDGVDAAWTVETTPFDAEVRAEPAGDGRTRFAVTVRVPTLSAVTVDDVADVVEEGWAETFELRVVDVGGVVRGDHDFDPLVAIGDEEIRVEFELTDINERRGVDDAGALVTFVEGTYVQGVIPGYEYTEPVTGLLSSARQQGNDGAF